MALQSDLKIVTAKFDRSAEDEKTKAFNENLIKVLEQAPPWWEVGAERYREMRARGETPLPKFTVLETGKNGSIPSREKGRDILTRIFEPEAAASKGVYMHIHGGGFVLQRHNTQDLLLKAISDAANLTVVSVDYRLGPENIFPAGPEDCFDAAEWLVDNAKQVYGNELLFIGGESAGGCLSASTLFHLMKTRPHFQFKAVLLNYGVYDMSNSMPQARHWDRPLVLTREAMKQFTKAIAPGKTDEELKDPAYSPYFTNLPELVSGSPHKSLPPALFACGTEDPLLDDTLMMSIKWQMAGAEAMVKIYPGAPHGFTLFPVEALPPARSYREDMKTFLLSKM
ncbi:MAG: hypothetical protein M1828_001431 [Chrysothrix sp. TS-e1954]|nr:MAG: hypothetical protein M1828_001431 [Chrysothrix sp. TS-e1954]